MKSLVYPQSLPTILPCSSCSTPVAFYSSVSTCPNCGSALKIVDSSASGRLVKLLRKRRRGR